MTAAPYYVDDYVTLYKGDCREVIPGLGITADAVLADPPYGETSLPWDRWPDGWPTAVASAANSMWCFGSLRMFTSHWAQFAYWRLSQDLVWQKHNGSGFQVDRFRRVHEGIAHFYRGSWTAIHKSVPTTNDAVPRSVPRRTSSAHTGDIGISAYSTEHGGPRQRTSILACRNMNGRAIHPTEKPVAVLSLLLEYAVPPGGLVLDPFAGSGSTAEAARLTGRRAVLIEADERYCEAISQRLSSQPLPYLAEEPS